MYVAVLAFMVVLYGILPHIGCLIPPKYLFSISMESENDLNKGVTSDDLQSIFQSDGRYLSESAAVERVDDEWQIVDRGKKYSIRRDDGGLSVYSSSISDIFHPHLYPLRSYATRYGFDPDATIVTTLLIVGLIITLLLCFLIMREFEGAATELTRDVKKRLR